MTESAHWVLHPDEQTALTMLKEAGFHIDFTPYGSIAGTLQAAVRLIALARQRPGWQFVPLEPTEAIEYAWHNGHTSTYQRFRERWRNALAAAPKPEDADVDS